MYKLYIGKNLSTKEILKRHNYSDDVIYDDNGKPFFKNLPIFFNVSNSHEYTVLCISDKRVGVDIEKMTYKKRVIERICNDSEKKMIHNANDFTKIWVKKESYVKMLGDGIAYGLKNVDTTKIKNIKVKKYKEYYIAICTQ